MIFIKFCIMFCSSIVLYNLIFFQIATFNWNLLYILKNSNVKMYLHGIYSFRGSPIKFVQNYNCRKISCTKIYHLITYASELIQSYSTFQTTLHLIALGNEKVDPCPPAAPLFVLNHTNLLWYIVQIAAIWLWCTS